MTNPTESVISSTQSILEAMKQPEFLDVIDTVGQLLKQAALDRKTVFIAGNGGSWADADHFAGELRAQFEVKGRAALPAVALPISLGTLTAWGNDYEVGFETAITRDLEALGKPGDIFIAISTSGKAKNIRHALAKAKAMGLTCIAISGNGPLSKEFGSMADYHLSIPNDQTARIQEAYQVVIHIFCMYIDSVEGKI